MYNKDMDKTVVLRSFLLSLTVALFVLSGVNSIFADTISELKRNIAIERLRKARAQYNSGAKQSASAAILQAEKFGPLPVNPSSDWLSIKKRRENTQLTDSKNNLANLMIDTSKKLSDLDYSRLYELLKDCTCGSDEHLKIKRALLKKAIEKGDVDAVRRLSSFLESREASAKSPIWKLLLALILFGIGLWQFWEFWKTYRESNRG
jgi:hypothetical protein